MRFDMMMKPNREEYWRRALKLAGAAVLVVAVSACNLFEPREAEDPGGDDDRVPFRPANSAAGVFPNLQSGVENLANGENYDRSLADNFVFRPLDEDAIDPSLPPGIYEEWTRDVEMNVLKLMISESSAATVTFNSTPQINENDFVQFRVTYVLVLTSGGDGSESELRGVAEFDVRRVSGIWVVEQWRDIERVEDFTTWGYLRGSLRAQLGG